MPEILLPSIGTLTLWRRHAKRLIYDRIPPEDVAWRLDDAPVVDVDLPPAPAMFRLRVSERFLELSSRAIWHSSPQRFALLYDLLWRLRLAPKLASDTSDPTVAALIDMEQAVERQKMILRKQLRFESCAGALVAQVAPKHPVLEAMAPSLAQRYHSFDWVIHAPEITLRHRDGVLKFGAGVGEITRRKPIETPIDAPMLPGFEDHAPTCGGLSSSTPLIFHP